MLNLNFFKKEKKVYFRNKELLVRVTFVEKRKVIYIKKPLILENNFKIKEKLKENFDVFFNKKRKKDIFPIIKLTEKNVKENELNYAIQIGETPNNIMYCVLEYNNATVLNKEGEEKKEWFSIQIKELLKKKI